MITAFTAGLIDNVAYNSRSRTPPAAIAENCRVDNQGWLVRRKGLTAIDALPESDLQIPEYPEVEDIEVTYGEAGGLGAPGEFRQVDLVFQAVKLSMKLTSNRNCRTFKATQANRYPCYRQRR